MQGQGKFRQSRSTKPLSWEPANPGQGSWSHATTTPHHRATGIGVALWTPICPGVSSTGTGMGDTCPSNISGEKLRSGGGHCFHPNLGGNSWCLRISEAFPAKDQGMEERLLLALPLLIHHPQNHAHNAP